MSWFYLFLFGVAIGTISGMLGIGGGVLLVPGLMLLFGFTQQQAQGTSLAVLIPPIGIFAALVYYRHGDVNLPQVGYIALGFVVGALVGALLVPYIPQAVLKIGLGLIMLYLGFMFVFNPSGTRSNVALPAGIAAVLTVILGRLLGKKFAPKPALHPPRDGQEYHI